MRVALAEDGVLFREGVTRLLGEAGFTVTARCATADELLQAVGEEPPDAAWSASHRASATSSS